MNADRRHLARLVLAVFLSTFASARVLVFLIMDHRLPDFYFYVGETHVHHLNYGIFLLSAVGALLLFGRPGKRSREVLAVLYAIGLALTFDEFGMWLHLHDGYWQRASFDSIILIAALLGLLAFLPDPHSWSLRKKIGAGALLILLGICFWLLTKPLGQLETRYGPALHRIENNAPQ